MRALTARQPWAWAIIHGGKDVENRSRNIAGDYRGAVAVHAAVSLSGEAWADRQFRSVALSSLRVEHDVWASPRGAVIGVVNLVDVHPESDCCCVGVLGRVSPWAMDHYHHLILASPRPLAHPIPWRGALGLWTVPADLEAAIREQVPR